MITAKEAKDLMANSAEAIEKQLEQISNAIRVAASKGERNVDYRCPTDEFRDVLINKVKEYGFHSCSITSNELQISW